MKTSTKKTAGIATITAIAITALVGLLSTTPLSHGQPNLGEITGKVEFLQSGEETLLAIRTENPVVMKGEGGEILRAKLLQLAGINQSQWLELKKSVGKIVTAKGRPMEKHTIHHHTEILWLVESLDFSEKAVAPRSPEPGEREEKKPVEPSENPARSMEW
jgi:hypothetical protein